MARFPIQYAEVSPSGRAASPRANIDVSTGEGAVGAAAAGLGGTIMDLGVGMKRKQDAIEAQRQKMRDARSEILANDAVNTAIKENMAFRDAESDTTKWKSDLEKRLTIAQSKIAALAFSPEKRLLINAKANATANDAMLDSLIAETKRDVVDTREAVILSVTKAFQSGDEDSQGEAAIRFMEATSGFMDKNEQLNTLSEAIEVGKGLRHKDAVAAKRNQASIYPDQVSAEMEAEKSARRGGEGNEELSILTGEDLEDIIDFADSVGDKNANASTVAVNSALVDSYDKIREGETDIDALTDAINLNPNISAEDKLMAADKLPTYFKKINSLEESLISDESAYDELTIASEAVERGAMSPAAFEELYANKKHLLSAEDQRAIRSKDIVATRTMQNRAFIDASDSGRPTLVELTEGEMGKIQIALLNAEAMEQIETVNFFNIAIKKNQAERWNYARYKKDLRTQMSQNPDWSHKQIYVAEELLRDAYDIPTGDLLMAFDKQNPKQATLGTPPNDKLADVWDDLSIEDKAAAWELIMNGTAIEVLIKEINSEP